MNNLIIKIQLSKAQIANKSLLKKDEKVLKPIHHKNDEEFNDEVIKTFNKKKNFKLIQALKKAL